MHRKAAEDHGVSVGRIFVSPHPHIEARSNERRLIALGGIANRSEYLRVNYDAVPIAASGLPMNRASRRSTRPRGCGP